jgi:hypothetical protein
MPTARSGRRSFALKFWVACAAALLFAACSDGGTGPSVPVQGSYTLTSYDSHALPVVLRIIADNPITPGSEGARCEDRLAAMVLELGGNGRFTATSERRLVCDNGDPDAVTNPSESGSYETAGTAVTLTFDEVDGSVTVATGTRSPNALTITRRVTTNVYGTVTDPTPMKFGRIVGL